jgi:hypothetical protein
MPTLADIYSAIDSAKRRASDFIQNPGTSLDQMLGYANDRARNYNQQMVQAAQGFGAPARGQQATPEQQAAQQDTMQTMSEAYNPAGMTVFHGSPHVFERFDLSKLGTGEGNQAYGRGMYVAQNPSVAEDYRNTLTGNQNLDQFNTTVNGKIVNSPVVQSIISKGGDPAKFIQDMQPKLKSLQDKLNVASKEEVLPGVSDYDMAKMDLDRHQKMVDEATSYIGQTIKKEPLGNFYKVDLPDTHIRRMLDWDEPLKNQPSPVRNLAKSLGMDLNDLGGDLVGQIGKGEQGKQILQNAGIPGIKYLDEKSRWSPHQVDLSVKGKPYASNQFTTRAQADEYAKQKQAEGFSTAYKNVGTRNFVVFDPNHLNILERNNRPIK